MFQLPIQQEVQRELVVKPLLVLLKEAVLGADSIIEKYKSRDKLRIESETVQNGNNHRRHHSKQ